jgi:hypothetical protein
MVAIRRHRLSKSIQTGAMLCFEAQFIFHLLNKSLAADRDRLRATIVSQCLRSILLRPIHDAPCEIVTTVVMCQTMDAK